MVTPAHARDTLAAAHALMTQDQKNTHALDVAAVLAESDLVAAEAYRSLGIEYQDIESRYPNIFGAVTLSLEH